MMIECLCYNAGNLTLIDKYKNNYYTFIIYRILYNITNIYMRAD